jgi:Concanavalin A-like lectin/glucanases superfamily
MTASRQCSIVCQDHPAAIGIMSKKPSTLFDKFRMAKYSISMPLQNSGNSLITMNTKPVKLINNLFLVSLLLLLPTVIVRGQSLIYSNAIANLNPAGYWPMHEIAPAVPADIETNYGSLGALGTAYYADWALSNGVPGNHSVLHQVPGPLVNDPNTAAFMMDPGITATSGANTNSYLLVPHTSPLTTLRPPFTEELWMMATNTGFGDLISQDGTATNAGNANNTYGLRVTWGAGAGYSAANQIFQVYNGITTPAGNSPNYNTNMWHYVVLVCDASSNYTLYVDNGLAATKLNSGIKPDSWDPITIGAGLWQTSGLIRQTALSMDEVAIYTNALTFAAISNHFYAATNASAVAGDYYNAVIGNNPLLYYRMDSPPYTALPPANTWPVLNNYGTTAANGVYRPGVAPGTVAGPFTGGTFYTGLSATNAMPGNGLSSFADAGNNPAFNPTNHMPLSITACFQGNPADSRYQNIVGHSDNSWRVALNTDGRLHFNVVPGGGNDAVSSKVYNDGNWHQFVAAYDGTSNYLYVDGVLDGQTLVGTNTIPGTTNDVLLGADPQYLTINTGAGRQFAGNLCEVAFFTNALSFAQVRTLYNNLGVPLSITQQPISASINSGAAFTNTVAVYGSAPIYQWYKDNVPITGATNSTLVFNPVTPANADTNYYVVVTNFINSVTSSVVSLTVYSNVLFMAQFPVTYTNTISLFAGMVVNGTNYLGSSPSFSVSAVGAAPINYQWFTNNVAVGGATGTGFGMTNSTMTSPTNIYCVGVNSYGSTTSTVWSVSYLPAPMAPFPQAVLAAHPVAYWRLNEGPDDNNGNNGVICNDYQSGNNGIYTNVFLANADGGTGYSPTTDPAITSAQFGSFAATSCDANSIGTNIDFSGSNNAEFAVAVWANGYGGSFYTQEPGNSGMVTKGYFNGEQFTLDNGGITNGVRFEVRNAALTVFNANSAFQLGSDPNWHYIVGVCDEAHSSVSLYIDGVQVTNISIPAGSGLSSAAGVPIMIGARSSVATAPGNQQYKGLLNDAAVYGYALSPGLIVSQFQATGRTVPPYFAPTPSTNASAGSNKTLTIPVTAIGTPPIGFVWTNVTAGGSVVATGVTNAITLNATLNYANVPASWNSNRLELIVTNAYGTASAFVTLSITNSVSSVPTNIVFSAAGGNLTLSWPLDHTGWRLQSQTNTLSVGINTNWVTVAGSTATNQVIIPMNLTNGSVFYRLVYP